MKTNYQVGDVFDSANAVITAAYSDSSTQEVINYTHDLYDFLTIVDEVVVFPTLKVAWPRQINLKSLSLPLMLII